MTENHNIKPRRFPAEWETVYDGVMISWPHEETDWAYMLSEIEQNYIDLAAAILKAGMRLIVVTPQPKIVSEVLKPILDASGKKLGTDAVIFEVPTNDTWIRDYGFLTSIDTADGSLTALDFTFNGWGMKFAACRDNQVTHRMAEKGFLKAERENLMGFVLEGGSVESDGKGTILTTAECLLSQNRNDSMTRDQIESAINKFFGTERVLMLENGFLEGDDTDSHVDTLARMAENDSIVYVSPSAPDDIHTPALSAMEKELMAFKTQKGTPYRLIAVPMPDAIFDEEGFRLPATYANFLVTPKAVLLPVYAQPENDTKAIEAMKQAFPGKEVICVDCRPLVKQHGSLHCATMQVATSMFNFEKAYKGE